MSQSPDINLDQFIRAALRAIRSLEIEIASLSSQVGDINEEVGRERSNVQHEREEMDIFYSLETGTPHVVASPEAEPLRIRERDLTEISIRTSMLERKLADFATVLSISRRQFETDGDLPDIDAAGELALRIARIQAQEEERRRFARDIHDGPAQAFANAIIGLEFVERAIKMGPSEATALGEIERIKGSLREGLTEIRRFMFDLKPTMLQDRGLVATIEHYISTYRSILPMEVLLETSLPLPDMTFDQEMTAFRVIQESLHNATKYSRASKVVVTIGPQGETGIAVSVCDNGRGFDPGQVTATSMGGTGIKGMKERADLVGGVFRVESAPGKGTCVYLVLQGTLASTPVTID